MQRLANPVALGLFGFALLAAPLCSQVSVGKVEISPLLPTLTDTINLQISLTAPSGCEFLPEDVQTEDLPDRLRFTLPACSFDGSPLVERPLSTFVDHQLPGTYLVEIFPGPSTLDPLGPIDEGPDPTTPPDPEPLWTGTIQVVEPPEEFYTLGDETRIQTCGASSLSPGAPCAYQKALLEFFNFQRQPDPRFRWKNNLDWDFRSWRDGGSQNLPLLAQSLALVLGAPDLPRTKTWWHKFFDCQVGGSCTVPNSGTLPFFSGGEILSNNYNHDAILAAMVVNFWMTRPQTRDLVLARKARSYLRATWYFYTLAAGTGEVPRYRQNAETATTLCQWTANNRAFYNGPFLALAGGRSKPTSGCIDDRAPLYADAIQWEAFTRSGESFEQRSLRDLLRNRFVHDAPGAQEFVFAIDAATRDRLKRHIRGTTNEARWLADRLTELRVRLSREMRFLGWSNGVRATSLAENPNTCTSCENGRCGQTAALFAAKFTPGAGSASNEAHFLFPWSGGIRKGLTRGQSVLLPNSTTPTKIQASNLAPGETPFPCQLPQVVEMSLPLQAPSYFVIVGSAGVTCFQCP